MSLEVYQRGRTFWAKGRVDYNGRAISHYIRESTGSPDRQGALDWVAEKEELERRRHLVGEESRPLTFADVVLLYEPTAAMATYLKPIVKELGDTLLRDITPKLIRDLGPKLYPDNCTDTWRRWVVTPARAVINHAHELKGGAICPAIKIKGYSEAERVAQDRRRKKASRIERRPGDWAWLLRFREHAPARLAALALFMFVTGRRVGQSTELHPDDLDLQHARVRIPGAKGHADTWIDIPMELVVELANLKPKVPRGWNRNDRRNKRVFGYASSCGPLKAWRRACKDAKIDYRPPHSAGRHGFGQEHVVRQGTDDKAAGKYGGWSDLALMRRTYTHAEDVSAKIHAAFRAGLDQAETATGLKLAKEIRK